MEEEPVVRKAADYTPGFERFWQAYPPYKRKAKKKAFETWKKDKLEDIAQTIVFAVEHQANFDDHFQKYTPMPVTYLNQARWEDEKAKPKRTSAPRRSLPDQPPPLDLTPVQRTANMVLLKSLIWASQNGHTVTDVEPLVDIKNALVEDCDNGVVEKDNFIKALKRDLHGYLKKLPYDAEYLEKRRQEFVDGMKANMAKAERARYEMGENEWYRAWKEGA